MNPNKLFTLLTFVCICATVFAQEQTTVIDSLSGHLINNLRSDKRERTMLQTDRKIYVAGEKIWFNAFLLRQANNRIDTSSKNLFVDLVNDKDSVITRVILNTTSFNTSGALVTSDTLANGYYWVRCYTRKVVREGLSGLYIQPVYIINRNKQGAGERVSANAVLAHNASTLNNPVINFFAEGGSVTTGITSSGALQVTDAKGNPLIATGYVTNEIDSIVARFTTNRFGLAPVSFFPAWFHKYTAVVRINNQSIEYPLPKFDPFAAKVSVTSQSSDWLHAVVTLEDSINSKKFPTFLLGISGDSICFSGVGRGMYSVDIPVNDFPGGIATLLLFDAGQHLLSERKVFINKDNYTINVQADKPKYAARDKVAITVALNDGRGRPLVGALNVAVQDESIQKISDALDTTLQQPAEWSLNEWLKLEKNKFSAADIDLLMLAQKPGFTNWTAGYLPQAGEGDDETELLTYLHGKLTDNHNKPIKGHVVTEISKNGRDAFFDFDTTNTEGRFRLLIPQNRDSLQLNVQVTDKHGNISLEDRIIIDTFDFPDFTTPVSLKENFFTGAVNVSRWLRANYVDTMVAKAEKGWLKPVIVKGKIQKQENYDVSKRLDQFSSIISSDKLAKGGYHAVGNALLMVPGVSMSQGFITIFGGDGRGGHASAEPILIVDGQQVTTETAITEADASPVLNYLNNIINAQDIDFIEVLTGGNAAIYGMRGGHGVIVVHTKMRYIENHPQDNGFKLITPVTYHVSPKFNVPNYDDKLVKNNNTPDPRNTIYWNGNVITGTDGKAYISFYTADAAATYVVTVTGITQKGDYITKKILINRK